MSNAFSGIFERDDDWYVASCPEVPVANGQGRTKEEARASLAAAICLILEDRLDDALRGRTDDTERETVTIPMRHSSSSGWPCAIRVVGSWEKRQAASPKAAQIVRVSSWGGVA